MPVTQPVFDDVAPWPELNPRAVIGGNQPPIEERIPAEFRAALLAERPDFLQKLDDLLGKPATDDAEATEGAVHRAKCDSDETLAKCASLLAILRAAEKHVDTVHTAEKKPHLEAGRLVDGQKNALNQRISAGRQIIENLQFKYAADKREKERQRLQKEAEERAALEALARENNLETALPPAPEPDPAPIKAAPIRSDDGATVSLGVEYVATVTDYRRAFTHVKNDAKVKEAIDAAIKRYAKAIKATDKTELAGVKIVEQPKVNNR
ncbi:hypothetical protein [Novosphingobium sp.]|uniref:hypothetical protein n=1 Tax=Novosphingobium sp. TaxID=1874826 RepID=UPI00352AEE08